MRSVTRLSAVAVLLSGLAVLPASPAAAGATASVPLPIDRAVAVALDEAHGRLFVSAGPDRNEVLVTDLAGTEVRRLTGLPGASGLLLDGDTLYVALHGAGAIAAFDTSTLAETRRWSLPVDACPDDLALTADRLVFTAHHCNPAIGGSWLGTLDRASGKVTQRLSIDEDLVIAANPASNGLVAVADTYASPSNLLVYDVRGDEPTALRGSQDRVNVDDLAMAPDGRSVLVSGNDGGFRVPLDTLTFGRSVATSAVAAWSGDGQRLVIGSGGTLSVWPEGGTATSSGVAAPYGTSAKHGRLALDRTASRAWVVSTDYYDDSPVLVRYDLAPNGTAWSLSASRIVLPAYTSGTLRADLRVAGQPVADGTRMVVIVEHADDSKTNEVHYTRDGGITLSLFPAQGVTRYRFTYSDNASDVAYAYADVVGAYDTRLSLYWGPEPPLYPDTHLGWSAQLTDADGRGLAGRRVTLTRTSGTSSEQVAAAYTDRDGNVLFQIPGNGSAGTFTFTLRYAGDESASPAEHSTVVTIDKKDPYVWVEASRGTGRLGRTATVVGHLGNFHTNRTLTITATPDGGSPQVIAQGEVDENLTLTVQYPMKRNTTFTVTYAGDDWYMAAESSTRLTLR
ncbi:hypothetical protein EV384_1541 [Micromonospora kangleipakensis]|uniref:Ig-like domain repeat protein n=1 Tax=Micromonospora kangleipakensis TaxID=1077942 RepID=A0A4Q8B688_9ACTN|nr:hypothetical protein [Micromonospora kangleipakensis]RZU73142.1 hypothetical protein EV384_1541 [Micromonospora kangleipakensis]